MEDRKLKNLNPRETAETSRNACVPLQRSWAQILGLCKDYKEAYAGGEVLEAAVFPEFLLPRLHLATHCSGHVSNGMCSSSMNVACLLTLDMAEHHQIVLPSASYLLFQSRLPQKKLLFPLLFKEQAWVSRSACQLCNSQPLLKLVPIYSPLSVKCLCAASCHESGGAS